MGFALENDGFCTENDGNFHTKMRRFRGGWKPAPWKGQVDEAMSSEPGRGPAWVCSIDDLEPDSKYIVRVRALARMTDDAGHEIVGWCEWSERSNVIATSPEVVEVEGDDAEGSDGDAAAPAEAQGWGAFFQAGIAKVGAAADELQREVEEMRQADELKRVEAAAVAEAAIAEAVGSDPAETEPSETGDDVLEEKSTDAPSQEVVPAFFSVVGTLSKTFSPSAVNDEEPEPEPEPEGEPPYVPSNPTEVHDKATTTSIAVYTSLPEDSPEPEEWELEYGFRYRGGWKPAPWKGQVDETKPSDAGRGPAWVCSIDDLEPDSKYIVRVRAKAAARHVATAAGLVIMTGWGDWSESSTVIATPPEPSAAVASGDTPAEAAPASSVFMRRLEEKVAEVKRLAEAAAAPEVVTEAEALRLSEMALGDTAPLDGGVSGEVLGEMRGTCDSDEI